ncbi:MAG: hypothetical protein O2912_04180, partial [Proteobacteria bacterium]|nr:hypothetical protein [Pseudomonadota bacterium]
MAVNFEVFILGAGRWEMRSRYDQAEEYRAKKEIKKFEDDNHIDGVCMVRETYNPETNTTRDVVVYHSPWITKPAKATLHNRDHANANISRKKRAKGGAFASSGRHVVSRDGVRGGVPSTALSRAQISVESMPRFDGPGEKSSGTNTVSKLALAALLGLLCALILAYVSFEA